MPSSSMAPAKTRIVNGGVLLPGCEGPIMHSGRHELPPKKEETKEVKETKVETKAKPRARSQERKNQCNRERQGERLTGG